VGLTEYIASTNWNRSNVNTWAPKSSKAICHN